MNCQFVLRKQMYLEEFGKLWGHISTPSAGRNRRIWCWWASVGKSINVKASFDDFNIRKLEKSKTDNGYKVISQEQLFDLWPSFIDDLNNRMIFELLANE